jgi:non-homologous end joining protein Ku
MSQRLASSSATTDSDAGPVDRGDFVNGYELSKGKYVLLDDDIKLVKLESTKTTRSNASVPRNDASS